MLKLVISDDEGKTMVIPLTRDELTIGRKDGNSIRLTERNVSRRHARIVKRAEGFFLEDLASYNGIVINGARLADPKPMRGGDQILIGDYKLQVVEEAGAQ
ncbi:MAG: FHA domain-containing protein, partial [Deltaproteobacteria bacterium]|nr:FHA domain-containing protein [Deltaproteobacteria bacterium]